MKEPAGPRTGARTRPGWKSISARLTQVSRVLIDEAYAGRVRKFELQAKQGDAWQTIFTGETIGRHFTHTFPSITAQQLRLNILDASEGPTITEFQVF